MPEQKQPKAPVFNPELKKSIAALKEENSPQKLNAVINELVKSPLLAPAMFDMQGKPAPKPGPDGRIQLPKNTKVSLVMINSPEGKHYYLAFSDWEAAQEWQKQAGKGRPIMALRFDDFANMLQKNPDAAGLVLNPGANSLRLEAPLIASVKKTGRIVIAGDATARGSFLNDLARNISEMAFDYLDAPAVVLGSRDWITPAYELEYAFFPQVDSFIDIIHEKIVPLHGHVPTRNFTEAEQMRRAKEGI